MKSVDGIVVLIQEQRFQLMDDRGHPRLFILAHGAKLDGVDLYPLQRDHRRVRVQYEDSPTLIAAIAHDVSLVEPAVTAGQGEHR